MIYILIAIVVVCYFAYCVFTPQAGVKLEDNVIMCSSLSTALCRTVTAGRYAVRTENAISVLREFGS